MFQRSGPYGMATPNAQGWLSMRSPIHFGMGYGNMGPAGFNPYAMLGSQQSMFQGQRFMPGAVNQGWQPPAPSIPQTPLASSPQSTIAALRMMGKKL